MPQDFYNPGLMSQAAGHAASIASSDMQHFASLAASAQAQDKTLQANREAQDRTTQANKEAAAISAAASVKEAQTKHENDAEDKLRGAQIQMATSAYADYVQEVGGEQAVKSAADFVKMAGVSSMLVNNRKEAAEYIRATTVQDEVIPIMGGKTYAEVIGLVNGSISRGDRAAALGDTTGVIAEQNTLNNLLADPAALKIISRGTKSREKWISTPSNSLLGRDYEARWNAVIEKNHGKTVANFTTAGWTKEYTDLAVSVENNPEAALKNNPLGVAKWNAAKKFSQVLDPKTGAVVKSDVQGAMEKANALNTTFEAFNSKWKLSGVIDPDRQVELYRKLEKYIPGIADTAKRGSMTTGQVAGIFTNAVAAMVPSDAPNTETFEKKFTATDTIGKIFETMSTSSSPYAAEFLESVNFGDPRLGAPQAPEKLSKALETYSKASEEMSTVDAFRGLVPGHDLTKADRESLARHSVDGITPLSGGVRDKMDKSREIKIELEKIKQRASGAPGRVGEQPPTPQMARVNEVAYQFAGQYMSAKDDDPSLPGAHQTAQQKKETYIEQASLDLVAHAKADGSNMRMDVAHALIQGALDLTGARGAVMSDAASQQQPVDQYVDKLVQEYGSSKAGPQRDELQRRVEMVKKIAPSLIAADKMYKGGLPPSGTVRWSSTLPGDTIPTDYISRDEAGLPPITRAQKNNEDRLRSEHQIFGGPGTDAMFSYEELYKENKYSARRVVDDLESTGYLSLYTGRVTSVNPARLAESLASRNAPLGGEQFKALVFALEGATKKEARRMIQDTINTKYRLSNAKETPYLRTWHDVGDIFSWRWNLAHDSRVALFNEDDRIPQSVLLRSKAIIGGDVGAYDTQNEKYHQAVAILGKKAADFNTALGKETDPEAKAYAILATKTYMAGDAEKKRDLAQRNLDYLESSAEVSAEGEKEKDRYREIIAAQRAVIKENQANRTNVAKLENLEANTKLAREKGIPTPADNSTTPTPAEADDAAKLK